MLIQYLSYSNIFFAACLSLLLAERVWLLLKAAHVASPSKVLDTSELPVVGIQIPLFNEEVYEGILNASCNMVWPRSKLIIQVLDDSTDTAIAAKVSASVHSKRQAGYNIYLIRRDNRINFKAGALQAGMLALESQGVSYTAIFDADFLPSPDFLEKTIPYFLAGSHIAFVQARWVYYNQRQSLLTRVQSLLLDFHFRVEQPVRSDAGMFLNFNGTAGIWKLSAIRQVGGWSGDTLVEDADLSVRAYTAGFKGLYVSDVICPSQLPSEDKSYRTQQRRWLAGPMQLWKNYCRVARESKATKMTRISIFWYFARYLAIPLSAIFYLIFLPLSLWYGQLPIFCCTLWCLYNLCLSVLQPKSWWLSLLPIVGLEMGIYRALSVLEGLAGLKGSRIWPVTLKHKNCNARTGTFQLLGLEGFCASALAAWGATALHTNHHVAALYLLLIAGFTFAIGVGALSILCKGDID